MENEADGASTVTRENEWNMPQNPIIQQKVL